MGPDTLSKSDWKSVKQRVSCGRVGRRNRRLYMACWLVDLYVSEQLSYWQGGRILFQEFRCQKFMQHMAELVKCLVWQNLMTQRLTEIILCKAVTELTVAESMLGTMLESSGKYHDHSRAGLHVRGVFFFSETLSIALLHGR
jgi:hypothetical protein